MLSREAAQAKSVSATKMKYPKSVYIFLSLFVAMSVASCYLAWTGHSITLNESQILYLFSASSQVIAAIYGLTLTGYIFFQNELNRREGNDVTLTEVIGSLKNRYFFTLIFIAVMVLISILLANSAISFESTSHDRLKIILLNTGQSAFIVSLLSITYFIYDILSPNRIEKASLIIQHNIDPGAEISERGSLEDFLKNYNEIEKLLKIKTEPYLEDFSQQMGKIPRKNVPNAHMANILYRNRFISEYLSNQLRELIRASSKSDNY